MPQIFKVLLLLGITKSDVKIQRVVYTSMYGYSEKFLDIQYSDAENIDFFCFTDDENLRSDFWKIVLAPNILLDSHRVAKGFKHRPHLFFHEYAESLYLDNTIEIVKPVNEIFDCLKGANSPLMAFRHERRDCVYQEAKAVLSLRYDHADTVDTQMQVYRRMGYKPNSGLHASGFLLRRHNDPSLMEAMESWYAQVLHFSMRDQLSFDPVLWHYGIGIAEFNGTVAANDLMRWPARPTSRRLPRDFDDDEYLAIHPDVAAAGVNPRLHYLEHGMDEGRPYRESVSHLRW